MDAVTEFLLPIVAKINQYLSEMAKKLKITSNNIIPTSSESKFNLNSVLDFLDNFYNE